MVEITEQLELIDSIEALAGGPVAASRVLGVNYTGSFAAWKSNKRAMPDYIKVSINAHLLLAANGLSLEA